MKNQHQLGHPILAALLRIAIKERIAKLTPDEKRHLSEAIISKVEQLPEFKKAKNILLFRSLPDEVITDAIFEKWSESKCLILPVVKEDELELRYYEGEENLKTALFGIKEPQGEPFTEWNTIDLVLVPGIAFDSCQNRLGRGKGYYDRVLPKISGVKIGICFPCQMVDNVPCREWDVRVDKVVTI